ncbi:hypothetical protein [Plantactinospora sp. CA-290183]|uniref:hypothetical protein n=1 Tax=Plantactinospora sp. CA-290183 TaxID=3240006 RepID=UPI003D8B3FAD
MAYRPLPAGGSVGPPVATARRATRLMVPPELALIESAAEEPLAVVVVGPSDHDRRALLAGLLHGAPPLRVPRGSFLLLHYAQSVTGAAYVPGLRSARPYRSDPVGAGPALARPPRRVELTVPDPLLRHFSLVDAPETGTLGPAGGRVVRDAVRRGGALLFVIPADRPFLAAELELLAEIAGEVAVFFALTPGADGGWSPGGVETHSAALTAAVPGLAGVPWFALDPAAADTAYLRRALVDWASAEGLRRASDNSPVVPGATRTVRVAVGAGASGWAARLDHQVRGCAQRLRQHIALEVANIHLRCVQEIVFAGGCPGLPAALDREVEALSLDVVAECDAGVDRILGDALAVVFGERPDEGVRRRAAAAVGWGLAENRAERDLDRVLLVTAAGGVEPVHGFGAVGMLAAYPGGGAAAILPPIGVGLAGGCYQYWRNPAHADVAQARSWLQRVLREVELELSREVTRRFAAFRSSLTGVLTEAVRHGSLPA